MNEMMQCLISMVLFLLVLPTGSLTDWAWAAPSGETQKTTQTPVLRLPQATLKAPLLKPVTPVKIKPALIQKLPQLRPVVTPDPPKPKGPNPRAALDLSDIIEDPELLYDLSNACGWESHLIFQDEAAGHVFYYLPREILLLHGENGYNLNVQYNHRAEPGQPSVMVTAELAPPHREGDALLLKAILREALGLKPKDLLDLRSINGLGASVDLQAVTAGLSLPPDRIHMEPPAHLRQPFRLTLSLTQDEVEEVLAQISREGLSGTLKVRVGSESVPVPIRIQYSRFSGDWVKGFDPWVKGKPTGRLTNLTAFPLQVEAIHAYRMKGDKLERLSKELKKIQPLPPKAQRPFGLPEVGSVLGDGVLVAWLGASLDTACETCLKAVDKDVRKGVALAPADIVKLEAIPAVFSEFGIYKMVVRIRSPYFVAGGSSVREQEVSLTESENRSSEIMVYVPGDRGPDPLLYQYRLQVVKESGETVEENAWHDARKLSLFFGSSQVEALMAASEEGEKP
jgi:hypothetical protein